jgi:peptide/nickel transport system substrate-binding protein
MLKKTTGAIILITLILALLNFPIGQILARPPLETPDGRSYVVWGTGTYTGPEQGHWNPYAPGVFDHWPAYEPLGFWLTGNQTLVPWLGESYVLDTENLTLTVYLQQGVEFSDGTSFTSADVVTSFYIQKLFGIAIWSYLDSVEALDDYTVIFYQSDPYAFVLKYVFSERMYSDSIWGDYADRIIEAYETSDTEELDQIRNEILDFRPEGPVGTGPYTIGTMTEDIQIWVKRDSYWDDIDSIGYDEIRFRNSANIDPDVALSLTFAGEYSEGLGPTYENRPLFLEKEWYQEGVIPDNSAMGWFINYDHYPLNITEARQGLILALDREKAIRAAGMYLRPAIPGAVIARCTGTRVDDDALWGFDTEEWKDTTIQYPDYGNITKATEVLESAGFTKEIDGWYNPDGSRFSFEVWDFTGYLMNEQAVEQWNLFGIDVKYILMDTGLYVENFNAGTYPGLGFWWLNWHWGIGHPYRWYYQYWIGYGPTVSNMPEIWNVPWVGDVNATELSLELGKTTDPDEQRDLIQILGYIMNEYALGIPIWEGEFGIYYNTDDVEGMPTNSYDPYYRSIAGWWTDSYIYAFNVIKIHPPVDIAMTYSTVWFTEAIEAFEGADGKSYGPFEIEGSASIPTTNAQELVDTNKAAFSPPLPAGLQEAISSMQSSINSLSDNIAAIPTVDISGLTTLLYASIGLQIILLIVIVALFMMKK